MVGVLKKLFVGTSVALGMSAIATTPALAGSITDPSVSGSDYYLYEAIGGETFRNGSADLSSILEGSAGSPGGNLELFASSEQAGANFMQPTSLSGTIGGKDITISSLTLSDWAMDVGGGMTFAQQWFGKALDANGISLVHPFYGDLTGAAFNMFVGNGGLQRFSDPNISYVNQDDSTGEINIGLAGHHNAADLIADVLPSQLQSFLPDSIQASEVVKVTYNGASKLLYSFDASLSGLVAADDGFSHNGNYEVSMAGVPPTESVPEPSAMLGMMVVGGLFAASKRKSNG
jgi:hypothetical protein